MDSKGLSEAIQLTAGELGFELVGMVPVAPSETHRIYKDWLKKGYAGDMAYLKRHLPLKEDPRTLLPQAVSLVALAFNYHTGDHPEIDGSHGKISRYAWGNDYHELIHERLRLLREYIHGDLQLGEESRGFVDSGPVLEREYAWKAGLGWFGKHSNLIHWKKGSWLFLAELLLDIPLELGQPFIRVDCGSCTRCIEACPTDAIVADREVDSRRCISYLTIEHAGPIPHEFRRAMGNRIYGCDDCLAACPWNKFAKAASEAKLIARDDLTQPTLEELARLDDPAFRKHFSGSPIKRIGRNRFLRNVLIAMGNSENRDHLETVVSHMGDADPVVRGAAIWAFRQLATDAEIARTRETRRAGETDPAVQDEWTAA